VRDTRRTRLILAMLLLTAFTLITLDYRAHGGGVFGSMRRTAASWFGPVERLGADAVRPIRHLFHDIGSIGTNNKKLAAAQRTIDQLRTQLREQPFDQQRVAELDKLLHVSAAGQYKIVPAQVIAVGSGDGFEWTATIDAGSMDGLQPNMTVLNGDGLVGRLKVVGRSTSTVLLAIDPEFNVGVRLPTGQTGVLSGRQRADMALQLIDPTARVKPGDPLVTQGSVDQTPFVWGVPVGSVVTATSPLAGQVQTATVKPFVDFSGLDLVGVVVEPPRQDPRDAVLQSAVPTVTATVTVTATPSVSPPASPSTSGSATAHASRSTTPTKSSPPAKPSSTAPTNTAAPPPSPSTTPTAASS
jgi:rod shape-determining protein MreC